MKLQIETHSYNDRRYGRPYIATIDFSKSAQGEPAWGDWVGANGEAGILMIEAEPGAIIMQGQKDHRNSRKSAPDYYRLEADGTLTPLPTKADAYRAWVGVSPATA